MNTPELLSLQTAPTSTDHSLRILLVASEIDPLVKVGGLGDVTGSLPPALRALPVEQTGGWPLDIRIAIPFHSVIATRVKNIQPLVSFTVPHPHGDIAAQAFQTFLDGLPVYLIAGDPIPVGAPVYSLDTRQDGKKYTFFSLAVLELVRKLDWQPDILHANDWHTALTVYSLKQRRDIDPFFAQTRSIFTIHNLPFMGAGIDAAMHDFGIPPLQNHRMPVWGCYQPLPMGLATADHINTVSPTYACEIMRPEFGCGLQDFLSSRADSVSGIINGLDTKIWDPASDPALTANFNTNTLAQRAANKQTLIREFALSPNPDLPLLMMITRMDWQKGVDLAIDGLRQVTGLPWQIIFLGSGDPSIEAGVRQLEIEFPSRVHGVFRFDLQLARRLYGGGDMLLMPSRYEPCGLTQLIAMRYGCVPVARATGGLRDTVKDTRRPESSTGFLFEDAIPEGLAAALRRAIAAYQDQAGWRARQLAGMQEDFSWGRSASAYAEIYLKLHHDAHQDTNQVGYMSH